MRHLCILLVDDDKIERLKFKKVCQEVNFKNNIIEAKDGETALLLLNDYKTPFDLIISDLNMPGMDGFKLREEIGLMYPEVKVPFQYISSTREQKVIEKANELSILELVQKPARAEELSEVLKMGINKFAAA
jgi:YesN/AraC family two-component response regulator